MTTWKWRDLNHQPSGESLTLFIHSHVLIVRPSHCVSKRLNRAVCLSVGVIILCFRAISGLQ